MPEADRTDLVSAGQANGGSDVGKAERPVQPLDVRTATAKARAEHLRTRSLALIQRSDRLLTSSEKRLSASNSIADAGAPAP